MDLSKATFEIFTKLEQNWLSHCEPTKKTRILSIDGGGTTGIVAGAGLIHLEEQIRLKTGDPHTQIADFFDMIAGTGVDRRSSSQSEKFSGKSMDKALKEMFKREDGTSLTLKDTCKPLLVPCFDLKTSAPFVFSRADASESPTFNFELWKVCRATSATPSLFKPFRLISIDGKTSCSAVDGGLVMNNPTAASVTHVLHNKRDFPSVNGVEDLMVLSLGNGPSCGRSKVPINGECSTSSVVDIALDGVSETVDQMLGNAFCWNRTDYVRIQANGLGTARMVGQRMEEVLKERGVESLPFGEEVTDGD
ncbi:putative inactive patatin-like protein 9 [Hibiscus syriacus]|uniref:Patatin n=1 Tax=Hibiscus syriacus TaxID=106335 RepID=A0A6A2Z2H4_HIBSY|nr:putative inactive patatin-like protein 9 [Hibiscus syriacus]